MPGAFGVSGGGDVLVNVTTVTEDRSVVAHPATGTADARVAGEAHD
ncbi:hypothetical protein [Mycolicibacterium mageritense]|uniref:Uncharacterized protein n=1 Tax=Mycolicibacterium mageritense TaxID=53462 RepID=A0AAI8TYN4_MYCME|nr:hypothetical protein [Mycolicibacterium mageritense]BDY31424.1 hypothetical protein hbim_05376 [Mycolicibacterium mageritense]